MRKPEQKLWDTMRKKKPAYIYLERVENGLGAGMPDVYCKWQGGHSWVELKTADLPNRQSTRVLGNKGLNQNQINWHLQHASLGLFSWILIRMTGKNNPRVYLMCLIRGSHADSVNNYTKNELWTLCSAYNTWDNIFYTINCGNCYL